MPIECIVKSSTAQSRTEIFVFAFYALFSMLPGQQPPGYEFSSCSRPAPVGLRADHVVPGAARNLGVRYGAHICVSFFFDAWQTYRLAARFYPANTDVKSKETRRPALQVRCRCRESIHRCIRNGRPEFQVTLSIIFFACAVHPHLLGSMAEVQGLQDGLQCPILSITCLHILQLGRHKCYFPYKDLYVPQVRLLCCLL